MVIGENRKYLSALITLKVEVDLATGTPSKNLTPEAQQEIKKEIG